MAPTDKKTPKPRLRYEKPVYERVLQAYREAPGNHRNAARKSGCDRKAVTRLWNRGWSHLAWARPIKDVLGEETDKARVAAIERVRRERELAEADVDRKRIAFQATIDEEQRLMDTVRKDVLGATIIAGNMITAMNQFAKVVMAAVIDPATGQPLLAPTVTPLQAMKVLREYTSLVAKLTYAEDVIVKLGRLDRGQSTQINGQPEMSDEDALDEIAAVATLHDRMKAQSAGAHGEELEDETPPEDERH